jgi:1-acyl-sn-glycerol-3-phosphate acyltransferase
MRPVLRPRQRARANPLIDRDLLVRRMFPAVRALIQLGYFSFEVEGIEHVPREGPIVFAQNHAGWFALDAFFLTLAVAEAHGLPRAPFFATHDSALAAPLLGPFLRRFGAVPASWFRRPERLPKEMEAIGFFPEGVRGNTKPFWDAYRMRDWNRGFVRVAIARDAPIVPVAVLGGEECLPVAWQVRFLEPVIGSLLGAPLTLLPLPSRWKVVFHEPVRLGVGKRAIADADFCTGAARRVQKIVQGTLDLHAREYPLGRLSARVAEARARRAAAAERDVDPLAPRGTSAGPRTGPRTGPRAGPRTGPR